MTARKTLPTLPVTDPAFKWVSSTNTDIRARFERMKLEGADVKVVRPIRKGNK